jgi:hypothetical protein
MATNSQHETGEHSGASHCSAFDLGRLAEMDRKRLEAEKDLDSARSEARRWNNEEYRRWKIAVELGDEWMALKRELGLLPKQLIQPTELV